MLGRLSRTAEARAILLSEAEPREAQPTPARAALVASAGLFRDALAYSIAAQIPGVRVECHACAADVPAGPAQLALIAFDAPGFNRQTLEGEAATLRARCAGAAIGVLVPDEQAMTAASLSASGVVGVVSLSAGVDIAVASVRLMLLGGYCLPPEAAARAASRPEPTALELAAPAEPPEIPVVADAAVAQPDHTLTARERQVLLSLREGNQNKIIAYKLGISESTVKVHLRNLMKKLKVSNRTQVALGGLPDLANRAAVAV
jgi:DNA-binding NarL/FixJ family response regulator